MMQTWTTEEKALLDIKKIIAAAWRMNSQQLRTCYKKLRKEQLEILPGYLGSVFLKKLDEISYLEPEAAVKVWTQVLQDADWLLHLIQNYPDLDRRV